MIFRKATFQDFEQLCRLRKELAHEPTERLATEYALYQEEKDRAWIQKCLRSRQRISVLIAEDNGEICAHAITCMEKVPDKMRAYVTYRQKARLVHLYVSRTKRRQGIGLKLTQYTLKYLKKCGAEFVDLECYIGNKKADALYQKIGFKDVFVQKRFKL